MIVLIREVFFEVNICFLLDFQFRILLVAPFKVERIVSVKVDKFIEKCQSIYTSSGVGAF